MAENIFDPNYGKPVQPETPATHQEKLPEAAAGSSEGSQNIQLSRPETGQTTGGASSPPYIDIVELRNIRQVYGEGGKEHVVFENFAMSIPDIPEQGQFITIMGPSGCGKSTILRYIAGLQSPTAGEILIKGAPRDPRKSVPMVFQQYSNFEWKSVLHNVMLPLELQGIGRQEAEAKAMEMLKIVGLQSHADKYAKYPNLSGGQLQRVAIARSLVVNPSILLMDEPFGALDVKTRREMQEFLRTIFEAQEDMTVILVTHSESEAVFLSDKVIVLNANPATIVADITIDLHAVRDDSIRNVSLFEHYVSNVRKALS
jgi:NitT/TauT family transport system ATP-binding protein